MNSSDLRLSETTDHLAWDTWVDQSPQGTIFSKSTFLRSLNTTFRLFNVGRGHCTVALISVVEDDAGNVVRFPFTPYQGILFLHDSRSQPRQRVLDEFRITEFIIGELTRCYQDIAMTLSWEFKDIRPFLWHNYHEQSAARFIGHPRYTAVLDLKSMETEKFPAEVRACRRQELKKSSNYFVNVEAKLDDFLSIYASTFTRQGIALDNATIELVGSIVTQAIEQGYGRLSSCETPAGIASACLFLYDSKRAYYLFAANDPAHRNTGAATRLMFDNIFEAKRRGLQELDFVGVNSPNRGDFKLSFNPELKLYFDLSYTGCGTLPMAVVTK